MSKRKDPVQKLVDAVYAVEYAGEDARFLAKGFMVVPIKLVDKAVRLAEELDPTLDEGDG